MKKELAKKMKNPYHFTDRAFRIGMNIDSDKQQFNHTNSKLKTKPNFPEFGIELGYINKILKETASI